MSGRYYAGQHWGRPAVFDGSFLPAQVAALCECRHDAEDLASLMNQRGPRKHPEAADDSSTEGTASP